MIGAPTVEEFSVNDSTTLDHPAIGAVLSTAATLLGMEVVFVGGLSEETFRFERVRGEWPGIEEGGRFDRADSFCHRLLAGAPSHTHDAEHEPAYADLPARDRFGIRSYVGVPIRAADGNVVATLCGIDHRSVPVDEATVGVLRELAEIVSSHLDQTGSDAVLIRRTPTGWHVQGDAADDGDLNSAMVLADLMSAELEPGPRPPRADEPISELAQLKLSVRQLEHALGARVVVEQAIGVLAERQHSSPRDAFERLRRVARSRGRKVHDLAREVVASVNNPGVPLPPELAGRR